jgi:serine/threonine protein phosphatase PrpC
MSSPPALQLETASLCDIGLRRPANQDAVRMQVARAGSASRYSLFVVADGVGGNLPHGEAASIAAADGLIEHFYLQPEGMPLAERLARATEGAHGDVRGKALQLHTSIIGTTLTALALGPDGGAQAVSLGDSRLYRVRAGALELLTTDQVIGGGPGRRSTRLAGYMGQPEPLKPSYLSLEVRLGDVYLVCSDGLWSKVAEDDLRHVLETQPVEIAVHTLRELVYQSGAPDNLSAIIVRVGGAPEPLLTPATPAAKSNPAWARLGALLVVALIALAAVLLFQASRPTETQLALTATADWIAQTPDIILDVGSLPNPAATAISAALPTASFTPLLLTPRISPSLTPTPRPSQTSPPATATPLPPSPTLRPATATFVPPTNTRVSPNATATQPASPSPAPTVNPTPGPYQAASCEGLPESAPLLVVRAGDGVFVRSGPGREFRASPAGLGAESRAVIAGLLRQGAAIWYYVCPLPGSVVPPGWVNGDPALVEVVGDLDQTPAYGLGKA